MSECGPKLLTLTVLHLRYVGLVLSGPKKAHDIIAPN